MKTWIRRRGSVRGKKNRAGKVELVQGSEGMWASRGREAASERSWCCGSVWRGEVRERSRWSGEGDDGAVR